MYAKNISNLFLHLYPSGTNSPNLEDEIAKGCCLMHQGMVINENLKSLMGSTGEHQ